jgi:hypothetical protein
MLGLGLVSCAVPTRSTALLPADSVRIANSNVQQTATSVSTTNSFVQQTATSEMDFPDVNARLLPLASAANTVSGTAAFDSIKDSIENVTAGSSAGSIVGALYFTTTPPVGRSSLTEK